MSHLREGLGDEQFAFMPGRGTADTIFAVLQRMKKHSGNRTLYLLGPTVGPYLLYI